jgi:hypothetical protein
MIDPEVLKYLIALQPQIKNIMREWQIGDKYWCEICQPPGIHYITIGMSEIDKNGKMIDLPCRPCWHDILRIPPTIDDSGRKRGLWNMVDWHRWRLSNSINGDLLIMDNINNDSAHDILEPPQLALLKAIAAQNNVEVKG